MVHGIPSDQVVLKEGSIISIDCGLILDGWQADSAFTLPIGRVSPEKLALIQVTEECFFAGAAAAVHDNRVRGTSVTPYSPWLSAIITALCAT